MKIEILGKANCDYCERSKQVCAIRNLDFTYKQLDEDYTMEELKERVPSIRTFPAIFVDGRYVGGFNEFVKGIA